MFDFWNTQWRKDYDRCGRNIYIHKVVRCTYDPRECPWMWRAESYFVIESKRPEKEYNDNWVINIWHVDWVILKEFDTKEEAEKYIKWICLPDHKDTYDIIND